MNHMEEENTAAAHTNTYTNCMVEGAADGDSTGICTFPSHLEMNFVQEAKDRKLVEEATDFSLGSQDGSKCNTEQQDSLNESGCKLVTNLNTMGSGIPNSILRRGDIIKNENTGRINYKKKRGGGCLTN